MNYAIILVGGIGSRFWPLSREHRPKQFLRIFKKRSLFEATLKRARLIVPDSNIFIVTNKSYLGQIKAQLIDFSIPEENIILEPVAKNTLPAIALCAQFINFREPGANLLVLPSDHYIEDKVKFKETVSEALKLSNVGFLSLIGIKPDKLHLGYGLIECGDKIKANIFQVKSFREKPPLNEASSLFRKKNFYWNSGIFCFKPTLILNELKIYQPGLYQQVSRIKNKSNINKVWNKIKPISIDYGILEHSKNLAIVVGRFKWSDVGSWDTLSEMLPRDKSNNAVFGDTDYLNLDSANTFIYSCNKKRLIAAIGLYDLIIVDTPDALLICKKERTEELKELVRLLKKKRKSCV